MGRKRRKSAEEFSVGPLHFSRGMIHCGSDLLSLTPKEHAVLRSLATHHDAIVSAEFLLTDVWGDAAVGTESVHRAMSTLRSKLERHGAQDLITTIYGQGYRLEVPAPSKPAASGTSRLPEWQAAELVDQARSLVGRRLKGDLDLACQMLQRACALAPQYLPAHLTTVHLQITFAMRSFSLPVVAAGKAEDAARKVLASAPDDPEALAALGWLAAVIHGRPDGVELLNTAKALQSREWLPLFYRGWTLAGLGRFEEALSDFEEALTLSPLALGLHGGYGYVLLCAGETDRAYDAMSRSVRDLPVSDTACCSLSIAASLLGRHREAVEVAERGYELSAHPMAKAQLGYALAQSGNNTRAAEILRELTQCEAPAPAPVHVAALARALENHSLAINLLREADSISCPFRFLAQRDPRLLTGSVAVRR